VIPVVCARHPHVRFIVGGDGNKRLLLEEMREKHQLHDRVELLGGVPHARVRDVLARGHVFLNCSLTESFCIAILEAAAAGLFVVSTCVGGVPEVLPPSMIKFAEPRPDALINAIDAALPLARRVDPQEFHARVRDMYSWMDVAARTVKVYDAVAARPHPSFAERLRRYNTVRGTLAGWLCGFTVAAMYLAWLAVEWLWPREEVEAAREFPCQEYKRDPGRFEAEGGVGLREWWCAEQERRRRRRGEVEGGER
jgi:phosphatidylinositol N-acetylglucosaminyltransferase subunit A